MARQYAEYIEYCLKIGAQMNVTNIVVRAYLKPETARKLGKKLKQDILNAKSELDMAQTGEFLRETIFYGSHQFASQFN